MFVRTRDHIDAIRLAWDQLEAAIGSLRGRKFFGAFDAAADEYRACVVVEEGDDADALGLETGMLAGGTYVRARLHGEPPEVYDRIAPTFAELAQGSSVDAARPSIEYYRRRDEIELLLAITMTASWGPQTVTHLPDVSDLSEDG